MNGQTDRVEHQSKPDLSAALAYSNLAFATVIDWYKNADSKAQIILTLDGALITFLTSSLFKKPDELSAVANHLSHLTWALLMAMCLCLVGSIISALMCLWSRILLGRKKDTVLSNERKKTEQAKSIRQPSCYFSGQFPGWTTTNSRNR